MIKKLTYEEAARLRKLVKNRFLKSSFNGAGFNISQYAPSYQPLADDIIRVVPGTEASVTTNRLRKFFYYTDPIICEAEKLEKPSFGSDFIEALFKYVKKEPKISLWKWSVLIALVVISLLILFTRLYYKESIRIREFYFKTKVGANGWVETEIQIEKGDRLEISANGSWTIWGEHPEVWPYVGPEGYTNELGVIKKNNWDSYTMKKWLPVRDSYYGALIGRIGKNQPFTIGSKINFLSRFEGKLFLGCNDYDLNNVGEMVVEIKVSR